MGVKCNSQTDTYRAYDIDHKRWDILSHFGVKWGGADEIREMLAKVHKCYFSKEATADQLWHWTNRHLSSDKELPTSVLSIYCADKGLVPVELKAAS